MLAAFEIGRSVLPRIAVSTENWGVDKRWLPSMSDAERARLYAPWRKAVTRSLDWVDPR